MVRIAIAGATGGLGRTFVDAFVEDGTHEVFAMTRKSTTTFSHQPSVTALVTTYETTSSLKDLLEQHNIHTIISVMNPPTAEVHAAQDRLMHAAAEASCVRRFLPSEFAIDYEEDDEHFPLPWKHLKLSSRTLIRSLSSNPSNNLSHLIIHNGYLMDYFGMPHLPSHMIPEISWIDISARCAGVPGDGKQQITWTHTVDLARFVVAVCSEEGGEEAWKSMGEVVEVIGDKASFEEIIKFAQEVRDGGKGEGWKVEYSSLEELRRGELVEIPAYQHLYELFGGKEGILGTYAGFGCSLAMGGADYDADGERCLNKRYPGIGARTRKVRGVIEEAWRGR